MKDLFVVDSHCDSIIPLEEHNKPILKPYNFSGTYPQLQLVAMFVGRQSEKGQKSYNRWLRYVGLFKTEVELYKDKARQVYTYEDIMQTLKEGKHAWLASLEGGTAYRGSVANLKRIYASGVRVSGLCWASNDLAKSNRVHWTDEEDTGLSEKGRKIVKAGNKLGMIFDCSHMSDKSFWDTLELSKKPLVATHSNFRSLASHTRNLTDDMAKALVAKDGMIGLNIFNLFMSDELPCASDKLFAHLDYGIGLVGEDHIGFGFDIDGIGINDYPTDITLERSVHDQVIEKMLQHNYSEDLVRKVAGGNWLEFFRKYL